MIDWEGPAVCCKMVALCNALQVLWVVVDFTGTCGASKSQLNVFHQFTAN